LQKKMHAARSRANSRPAGPKNRGALRGPSLSGEAFRHRRAFLDGMRPTNVRMALSALTARIAGRFVVVAARNSAARVSGILRYWPRDTTVKGSLTRGAGTSVSGGSLPGGRDAIMLGRASQRVLDDRLRPTAAPAGAGDRESPKPSAISKAVRHRKLLLRGPIPARRVFFPPPAWVDRRNVWRRRRNSRRCNGL